MKCIALIPTNGISVSDTVESCHSLKVDTCVVYHNTEKQNVESTVEVFSNGSNLSEALNDGLKEIYRLDIYSHVIRVDSSSILESTPELEDYDTFIFSLQKAKEGYSLLGKYSNIYPLMIMFDNPFSHSGLVIPTKYREYYNIEFNRSQDFAFYLKIMFEFPFVIKKGICRRVLFCTNSASYRDRRGQLYASIQAIRLYGGHFNPVFRAIMVFLRRVKLLVK